MDLTPIGVGPYTLLIGAPGGHDRRLKVSGDATVLVEKITPSTLREIPQDPDAGYTPGPPFP